MKEKEGVTLRLEVLGVMAAGAMGTAAAVSTSYFFYLWLLESMRLVAAQQVPFFR
ncbi:MAG: hypothetical protein JNL98_38630 [Bryobacterales bacterium]|nr:hypothetical protein [Bryobacterales bacterium]